MSYVRIVRNKMSVCIHDCVKRTYDCAKRTYDCSSKRLTGVPPVWCNACSCYYSDYRRACFLLQGTLFSDSLQRRTWCPGIIPSCQICEEVQKKQKLNFGNLLLNELWKGSLEGKWNGEYRKVWRALWISGFRACNYHTQSFFIETWWCDTFYWRKIITLRWK